MAKSVEDLRAKLFSAKDGGVAHSIISKLSKAAESGDDQAKKMLADYALEGPVEHMRETACSTLARAVSEADSDLSQVFQRGLTDPRIRYWSILGFIKTSGRGAYEELARLAADATFSLADRGKAIKCLATHSNQAFDRNLPTDPGFWKEQDLRIAEIAVWAKGGFPEGQGYSEPVRHPALDKPTTPFEKVVSRFDKKLAEQRKQHQDPANPTAWLSPAAPEDIQRITARWTLPDIYLDFLTRFSPINVTISNRTFYNHLQLFGASELIEAQQGYSFNPVEQQPIEDWPPHLLVIASHSGDPFVLDLSKSDGNDAPVDTAEHGTGSWNFGRDADSFSEFLKGLAK
ncbi:SMI1/KNR4 family protein [Planctellipticum variicoloris]|uniref:SMI1/KNR4 family protein n=1 Tax=Planctellipticum variicoloris TaxID=3064265 RepID=UPI00301409B7|nr:SMI1/KNR4 family protein [Planctomycetaceae bacterium SH412]